MSELRQLEERRVGGGAHDPYRRLPSLLYGLFGAETPADVCRAIVEQLELVVQHDEAQVVEIDTEDLRVALAGRATAPGSFAPESRGDGLLLPLVAHGVRLGTLRVRRTGGFDAGDVAFLGRFGELAALALLNAHARSELQRLAATDPLTGLGNRRQLTDSLACHTRAGATVSLLLLDFDGLKAVNDTLGYDAGDLLIRAVADALASEIRPGESAARLGGDEFVAVLPGSDAADAQRRADAVSVAIDSVGLPPDVRPLFRGASVGVVAAAPDETPGELLRRAGVDMHRRKRLRKTSRAA
jgi:diguanylate cyclase (GGDEF)-like protein